MIERKFSCGIVCDERDKEHLIKKKATNKTFKYWGTSSWTGDQGNSSMCVGFSWAHWLTSGSNKAFVEPQNIYQFAKYVDEWQGENYDGTSVRAAAKVLKAMNYIESYQWTNDIDVLINALLTQGPVVVGTQWFEGMDNPVNGYMQPTGADHGGHAYLLCGVNTKHRIIKVKNSWGTDWGKGGYGGIDFDIMANLIANGECCLGVKA